MVHDVLKPDLDKVAAIVAAVGDSSIRKVPSFCIAILIFVLTRVWVVRRGTTIWA